MNNLPENLQKYDHHMIGDAIYFPSISNHEYHNTDGVSSSMIRKFRISELHAVKEELQETPALRFGSAAHALIVEGETVFNNEVAVITGSMYTATAKQMIAECAERGVTCIPNKDYETIKYMSEHLLPVAEKYLNPTEAEYPAEHFNSPYERALYWWEDEVLCKLKADVVRHPITNAYDPKSIVIVDYKTTKSCDPAKFMTSVKQYGYEYQAAWYKRGFEKAGFKVQNFVFVAQEKVSPYASKVFVIEAEDLDKYWIELEYMLQQYKNYKTGLTTELKAYNCPDVWELEL